MSDNSSQWWKDWWEEDYSWDGLAQKPWHGWCVLPDGSIEEDLSSWPPEFSKHAARPANSRSANLQDYWRDQQGTLIQSPVSGKRFTLLHLPMNWEDGRPTPLFYQELAIGIIQNRIILQKERHSGFGEFNNRSPVGPDRRLICKGCIIRRWEIEAVSNRVSDKGIRFLHINANQCGFMDNAVFSNCQFQSFADFSNSAFFSGTDFSRSTFDETVTFKYAIFRSNVRFETCDFRSISEFSDARFNGEAIFFQSHFRKMCISEYSEFCDGAEFTGSIFHEGAVFKKSKFVGIARFHNVCFEGGGWFERCFFLGSANFVGADFPWEAAFEDAIFLAAAYFMHIKIAGSARFMNTMFLSRAQFDNSAFLGNVRLQGALIFGDAVLSGSSITNPIDNAKYIQGTRAFRSINASGSVFLGDAFFDNRDVLDASDFNYCLFFRRVLYHGSKLHQGATFHSSLFHASLNPANLSTTVSTINKYKQLHEYALQRIDIAREKVSTYRGADPSVVNIWRVRFDVVLKELELCNRKFQRISVKDMKIEDDSEFRPQTYFRALEDSFRTLRQAMEDVRNRSEERKFFRLELLARRKRRDADIPWWERWLSFAYEATSDFGNSVARPFVWFFGLMIFFGLLYPLMASLPVRMPTGAEWADGFSFSLGRMLPFGPWSDEPDACSATGRLLDVVPEQAPCPGDLAKDAYGPVIALGTRLLASIQSFFAIVLFFLAALAARRRFQIN